MSAGSAYVTRFEAGSLDDIECRSPIRGYCFGVNYRLRMRYYGNCYLVSRSSP